jgi:AcrR family transcriptional regulator
MSERRARQLEERREKIMNCALRLFREEGYEAIAMQDIADAAEISKGSLYLQFANKEALAVALLEQTFDRLEDIIQRESASQVSAQDRLKRIVEAYIDSSREAEGCCYNLWLLPRLSAQPGSSQHDYLHGRIERISNLLTVIFTEGARDGTIRGDINAENIIHLFSLITVLFMERISAVRALAPMVHSSEENLLEEFLNIVLYYISAAPGRDFPSAGGR